MLRNLITGFRAFNPVQISVRFAKRRTKQMKTHYEFTDIALWRQEQGLTSNPNNFGPLTNLADYSYLDGRPVPLGMNQKRRMDKQLEYHERIIKLSAEVDFARDWYAQKQADKEQAKKTVIENKLKRKGKTLLPDN